MKRTWVIPALLVAGLAGLGSAAHAMSAEEGWRAGLGQMFDGGPADYNWSSQRWRDEDDRGPRWRRGYDDLGPRWRDRDDDDRRGYGPREGRRGDDDDRCGPGMRRGYGERGWGHHGGQGYGGRHGMGRGHGMGLDHDGFGRGGQHGRFGGMFDPAAIDSIKRELNITAQQEAAWTKYAGAVKEAADAMKTRREAMRAGAARDLSPEDHRKFRDSMMEQRRKEVDTVRIAADELVKSLDEKQVAIAREVLPGYAFGPGTRGAGMGWGAAAIIEDAARPDLCACVSN